MPQLIRKPETDSVLLPSPGEEARWVESFIYADDVAKTVWDVANDALVPKQGQRRATTGTPGGDFYRSMVCRSVEITPVPSSPLAWNVRVTWSTRRSKDGNGSRPWYQITRTTQHRTAAMYRSGNAIFSGVPADGTVTYPPSAYMGGNKVDVGGQPLQVKIAQQLIQVDFLWDRTKNTANGLGGGFASSPDPPTEWTSVYTNTRNNGTFLGWPAGYVTYLGFTSNHTTDEWMVVSHRFLADDWQHLEQRPAPNVAGAPPRLGLGLTWGTGATAVQVRSVEYVVWYQPYETLENFATLLNFDLGSGNIATQISTPGPAW
jgi:hypothetical protein